MCHPAAHRGVELGPPRSDKVTLQPKAQRAKALFSPGMFWAFPPGDDSVYRTGLEVLLTVDRRSAQWAAYGPILALSSSAARPE